MQLNHEQLCQLIPHAGSMCLLDSVVDWNAEEINCRAISQRDPHNPLRQHNTLAAINGIEYAAQAMAIHGALLSEQRGSPAAGYLAALRNIKLEAQTLHQENELLLRCHRLAGDANGFIYDFEVHGDDALLLSGRATVMVERGSKE